MPVLPASIVESVNRNDPSRQGHKLCAGRGLCPSHSEMKLCFAVLQNFVMFSLIFSDEILWTDGSLDSNDK